MLSLVLSPLNIMRKTSWINFFSSTDNFVTDSLNFRLFLTGYDFMMATNEFLIAQLETPLKGTEHPFQDKFS